MLNQQIPNPLLSFAKRMYPRVKNERIRRWMLNRMNAPAYRARITRLQALKEQVYLQSKMIADAEITASTVGYVRIINQAYYRTMFDLQKGIGVGFNFAAMPARVIETILKRPWSGEHYSSRIWDNTDALARLLNEVLTGGFMSGTGVRKMVEELLERTEVGRHASNRLVRTETTYMANAAELESYEEAEIDRYRFVATLDNRTSSQCRSHDLKDYLVSEAVPGKNMPPLHPFCRSTTVAVIGDETVQGAQRRARDPETGKTMLVPANMSYEQWRTETQRLQEPSKGKLTAITDEAINGVPYAKLHGLDDNQSAIIQEQHKELLRYARDENGGNECAFIFDRKLAKRAAETGQSDKLDFTSKASLDALYSGTDLFIMHNHPKNKSYSMTDLMFFMGDNIKTLSIVKNNGNVEVITKLEGFDKQEMSRSLARRIKKAVKQGSDAEYDRVVKACLEEWNGGMVEWIKSERD
ncbi:minor capsid protein [Paenibacillus oceani]|uniref:Minor capsid protein n=1 Tax=Paenibacillus oceani TaxID=2772510 RepID=A0A927C929_9BACL|nr:minor capsid protein [Paenibacillus oceani]MBD2861610.1 minor capsid protein [Paenibacillus oceani]